MIIRNFQIGKAGAELSGWLHPDYSSERESAFSSRPAVIICPGGGYAFHSVIEEDEAMGALYAAGFDVFSLHYSTGELIAESEPEAELAQAVSLLRHMAPELGLNGKVAVMGFSAGGHLSASLGCHWTDFGDNCRPDCLVLCYPVISMGKLGHEGSTLALCHGDEERVRRFSLENADVSCCPPAFIWHSQEDELVDVRNSMLFHCRLVEAGRPCEFHMFQTGVHGMAAGDEAGGLPDRSRLWLPLARVWLSSVLSFGNNTLI